MGQLREIITLVHNLDFYSGQTCNVENEKKRLMWHKSLEMFMMFEKKKYLKRLADYFTILKS